METTKIILDENGLGEIQLFSDHIQAGKMDISMEQGLLTVYHTEVDEAYGGKGYGKILLKQLVDHARASSLQVRPLCPYVLAQFKRHEADIKDIWLKESKEP